MDQLRDEAWRGCCGVSCVLFSLVVLRGSEKNDLLLSSSPCQKEST